MSTAVHFELSEGHEAVEPPEWHGVPRDCVRLLVAAPTGMRHHRFRDLPQLLEPGDVVVVNTSATLPAALDGVRALGRAAIVHVAGELGRGEWIVEIRRLDGTGPERSVVAGESVHLAGGVVAQISASYPVPGVWASRLWRARIEPAVSLPDYLAVHGRPIGYRYLAGPVPLADLQNVYATEPGSAEMPSAGRPFTAQLIVELVARGVVVAPLVLHAGVSSPELHEPPAPERFDVPETTARLVNGATDAGRRVVAVGTTVVRALESVAEPNGTISAAHGWTDLVLGPDRPARVVTALITGLHTPEASHLSLLQAVAGSELVQTAYDEAVAGGYLWHEFGDSMLFDFHTPPLPYAALSTALGRPMSHPAGGSNADGGWISIDAVGTAL